MNPLAASVDSMASFVSSAASSLANSGTESPPTSATSASLKPSRPYSFKTQCVNVENPDSDHKDQWGSSSVPIYQTATFKGMGGSYDYTRSGNPTRSFLEHHIAKISGAAHAFSVTSGMGALDVIFRLLQPGDEIIAGNDLYGGSNRLLTYLKVHNGITTHHISTSDSANFLPYLTRPNSKVRLVLLETPTNPLLQIADLGGIADLVHAHVPDAIVVVDNTMMSPYLQRPLEHGADLVYDSGTKYLSGHHDLMAGVIVCDRDDLAKRIAFTINSVGNGLAPFDSFLLLRGIKTLALRLDQQQRSTERVAHYLDDLGFLVHYPGLKNHPGKEFHDKQASGAGAVLSFTTNDKALSERIVAAAHLWGISVSFGCVNSLISMPCLMSHASIDPAVRAARNLPEDLIRLCVGIEDTDDLIDDLEAALLEAGAISIYEDEFTGERIVRRVAGQQTLGQTATASTSKQQSVPENLLVSAPGKVILFGEHAVVYGVTAIAGSVDLRCYCLVEPREDGRIALESPDLNISESWSVDSLPSFKPESSTPEDAPDAQLLAQLATLIKCEDQRSAHAAQAFLYLYLRLRNPLQRSSFTFTVRSALPISAGLGSSAAYSVCLASAFLYTQGHMSLPSHHSAAESKIHQGRRTLTSQDADTVNSWAFLGEKIIHGTPSGVDNSVASHGGALAYQKATEAGKKPVMEGLHGFKSLRFLLTDTKVPRNTKTMVAGLRALRDGNPEKINAVLQSIQEISDEARRCLTDTDIARSQQVELLQNLISQNSQHLTTLNVSHAAIETIRVKTAAEPYRLASKLTGAGGGGCVVTLIPDGFSSTKLESLKKELGEAGFDCYETLVGGSGLGLLLPSSDSQKGKEELAEGGSEKQVVPERRRFLEANTHELADWAHSSAAGSWLYV